MWLRLKLPLLLALLVSTHTPLADPLWVYSYELEQERRNPHKLIQQHALGVNGEQWSTALEYSHDRLDRDHLPANNIEALEWKLARRWNLSEQRHMKLEHKLTLPNPHQGNNADLLWAGHQHLSKDLKLMLETVLVYLQDDKADGYTHSGKIELSYFHHQPHWPANRSWLHIFKAEINAARNLQQADHYRTSTIEVSYQPKVMLNPTLAVKLLVAGGYDFNLEKRFPSLGVKMSYQF